MPAESLTVTELEGLKRSVQLSDRALPYWGVKMGSEQAVSQKWYPGSRVATMQSLGAREKDWELHGKWKTRFLAAKGMVQLEGFPDVGNDGGLITAEDLVLVFNRLIAAASTLEVRWGPEVRRGLIAEFDPTYDRVEDIEWSLTFKWTQRGSAQPARASSPVDSVADVRSRLDDLDLVVADCPSAVLPAERDGILARVDAVRSTGVALTESLARVQSSAGTTLRDVQDVQVLCRRTISAAQALRSGNVSDLPYVQLLPLDELGAVFATEAWRRDVGASSREVQASAARAEQSTQQRQSPGVARVVVVKQGESLRRIALREMGSADAWVVIADANNLTTSDAPVGTRLVIPRTSGSGGAAQ